MSLISLNETEGESMELAPLDCVQKSVKWCNDLHGQVLGALERAWQTSVVLGYELSVLKNSLAHGEFGKLFSEGDSNCAHVHNFAFTHNNANRYMRLFERCQEHAGKLDMGTELSNLLLEFSEKRLPETAERLTAVFNKLAPEATSMRQALFEFMKQEPEFTKRNELGRIKKDTPPEVLAKAATQELATHARQLEEIMDSGRYTLADEATRRQMEAVCAAFAAKLKAVK